MPLKQLRLPRDAPLPARTRLRPSRFSGCSRHQASSCVRRFDGSGSSTSSRSAFHIRASPASTAPLRKKERQARVDAASHGLEFNRTPTGPAQRIEAVHRGVRILHFRFRGRRRNGGRLGWRRWGHAGRIDQLRHRVVAPCIGAAISTASRETLSHTVQPSQPAPASSAAQIRNASSPERRIVSIPRVRLASHHALTQP